MKTLKGILRVIFTPTCWLQLYPYSVAWDAKLNQLLKDHPLVMVDQYTAKLGTQEIWVENYPFASFYPYNPDIKCRAKRITTLRAGDMIPKRPPPPPKPKPIKDPYLLALNNTHCNPSSPS